MGSFEPLLHENMVTEFTEKIGGILHYYIP
uniref:Uncharacterized protein n=1 Tax=Siphoviridae sp. ctWWc42 TaxID=2826361 RepID=A0A8S5R234_9CAUD|nr:MAG TPA: hypothetical protein [Siphoviridae sp. ctWWc42]